MGGAVFENSDAINQQPLNENGREEKHSCCQSILQQIKAKTWIHSRMILTYLTQGLTRALSCLSQCSYVISFQNILYEGKHFPSSYSIFQLLKSFEFKSSPKNPSCSHLGHTPCLMSSNELTLSDTTVHIT